jgi:hypothetical protein
MHDESRTHLSHFDETLRMYIDDGERSTEVGAGVKRAINDLEIESGGD